MPRRPHRARPRARDDRLDVSGAASAPVIVEAALPHAGAPVAPNRVGGAAVIEIVIVAVTVRIAPGIDAATLTTLLRAVKAAT
jgi:hypothetical protein